MLEIEKELDDLSLHELLRLTSLAGISIPQSFRSKKQKTIEKILSQAGEPVLWLRFLRTVKVLAEVRLLRPSLPKGTRPGFKVNKKHSHGLGVREFWCFLFVWNELSWQDQDFESIRTDKQIAEAMRSAFPDRSYSKILGLVHKVRTRYNRGVESRGKIPTIKSARFLRTDGEFQRVIPSRGGDWKKKRKESRI